MFTNTFRAFRYRDYFIFWCGLLLGNTGTLVQTTAQSWLLFQLTNSPFYLGLEGLCLGLPRVLFSAFGGAVVGIIAAWGDFFQARGKPLSFGLRQVSLQLVPGRVIKDRPEAKHPDDDGEHNETEARQYLSWPNIH